jgi:hypothetical protein
MPHILAIKTFFFLASQCTNWMGIIFSSWGSGLHSRNGEIKCRPLSLSSQPISPPNIQVSLDIDNPKPVLETPFCHHVGLNKSFKIALCLSGGTPLPVSFT